VGVERVEIGGHALYLGDALEVLPTLPGSSFDVCVTDPPYGHNNNNNGDLIHRWEAALGRLPSGGGPPVGRPIANDGAEANGVFRAALPHIRRVLAPGCCCCCCCGGGGPDPQFARWSLWLDEVFDFKQMVVWDKGPMGMGWHYRRSYETVLVAQKPGAACRWFDDSGRVENVIRPGHAGIRKIIPAATDHPTPKPVALAKHFLRLHARPGDVVLDPFMGRGWVALAAVSLGMRFVGVELDAEHFHHARVRVERAVASDRDSLFPAAPPAKAAAPGLFGDTED
jgi:DNA modification methylase